MTGTCVLCGDIILVRDCMEVDELRDRKTVTAFAIAMCQHIGIHHSAEEQSIVDRSNFPPAKPNNLLTLIEAASANGTLLTALSFLDSDELAFLTEVERMRDLILKSIERKPKPVVS